MHCANDMAPNRVDWSWFSPRKRQAYLFTNFIRTPERLKPETYPFPSLTFEIHYFMFTSCVFSLWLYHHGFALPVPGLAHLGLGCLRRSLQIMLSRIIIQREVGMFQQKILRPCIGQEVAPPVWHGCRRELP